MLLEGSEGSFWAHVLLKCVSGEGGSAVNLLGIVHKSAL